MCFNISPLCTKENCSSPVYNQYSSGSPEEKGKEEWGLDPTGCRKACLSVSRLGPGELVRKVWGRTRSEPPGRSLTCCPSPTRSPRRSQLEICWSSSSWWRCRSASQSSPLVSSPGQSRRRRPGRSAHLKPRRSREEESQPVPRLGKPRAARREMGLQSQPGVGYVRPHLRCGSSWLAKVHRGNPTLRSRRGTLLRRLPQINETVVR